MTTQELLKKKFSDDQTIYPYRLKSAKNIFVLSMLVTLMSFYFVGAKFHADIFLDIFIYGYIIMVFSLLANFYLLLRVKFGEKMPLWLYVFFLVLEIFLFVLAIMPVVFEDGILDLIEIVKL